jgi:hypothetical protein
MKGFHLSIVVLTLLGAGGAHAQSITDTGNPPALIVTTAVAGSEPTPVVVATTQIRAKTNKKNNPQKVTARLNAAMPAGLSLIAELDAIGNSTSLGPVTLSTTARDLVTGITNTNNQSAIISYTLQATAAAGVVALSSRIVTLTITDAP